MKKLLFFTVLVIAATLLNSCRPKKSDDLVDISIRYYFTLVNQSNYPFHIFLENEAFSPDNKVLVGYSRSKDIQVTSPDGNGYVMVYGGLDGVKSESLKVWCEEKKPKEHTVIFNGTDLVNTTP